MTEDENLPPISDGEPAPPDSEPDAPLTCTECGGELGPAQAYCLNCGEPTPAAPPACTATRATGLLAAGLIIAGLGAGAIGFAVATDGDGGSGSPAGATSQVPPTDATSTNSAPPSTTVPTPTVVTSVDPTATVPGVTSVDPTATVPGVTTPSATTAPSTTGIPETTLPSASGTLPPATTTVTTTRTVTTSEGSAARSTDDWPNGRSGWTAIVKSTTSRDEALAFEAGLASSGRSAGVLRSDNYSSLNNGYYVVFSGTYTTRDQAAMQARALQGRFPGAYPRAVVP